MQNPSRPQGLLSDRSTRVQAADVPSPGGEKRMGQGTHRELHTKSRSGVLRKQGPCSSLEHSLFTCKGRAPSNRLRYRGRDRHSGSGHLGTQ